MFLRSQLIHDEGDAARIQVARRFVDSKLHQFDRKRAVLSPLDRQMLSRVVLQEYTQTEAATLLGMSPRAMSYKFPQALDRLTEKLLAAGLLILPH